MGPYPPGSVFKPVTALAAMQEHLVSPYAYLPCTGSYSSTLRQGAEPPPVPQLGPQTSISRWTCRRRSPIRATRTSTNSAISSTACRKTASSRCRNGHEAFGFGSHHRSRRRPGGAGPRADEGLAQSRPTRRPLTRSAGRWTASGSRATRSSSRSARATSRDPDPDGPLLRADRERRLPRHPARAEDVERPSTEPAGDRSLAPPARARRERRRRRRPAGGPARPVRGDASPCSARPTASSASSPPDRGQDRHGREDHQLPGYRASRTSPGGAGTSRPTTRDRRMRA